MIALLLSFAIAGTASAQTPGSIKEVSRRTVTMPKQKNCQATDTCDLKSAKLIDRKIKVLLPDEPAQYANYMSDIRFVLEFSKPSAIERYGLVQYIQGCMFGSTLKSDGNIEYSFTHAHKNFGDYKPIKYKTPIVDSDQADPLLTAFDGYGRFDLYRWNKDSADLDAENATWYFDAPPPHGTVFFADLISNTGLQEGTPAPSARNSSVEFETCLFKISDLPNTSDPQGTGIDKNKAIWCTTWDHKFVYNFKQGKVIQEKAISPICDM